MRKQTSMLLCLVATWLAAGAAAAQEIKVGGTGSALGPMQALADAFGKQNPGMTVTVLPSIGTSGAIKAVPGGALDIGLSARPLTEEERKLGAIALEYARSPLVFAVAARSRVTALSLDQIADIYSGRMTSWPDGSQIRPVMRQTGDDTTRQLRSASPGLDQALSAAEQRPGLPFATTDQEAADKTGSVPGALGVTTLSMIRSENRPLRALVLDGVEPTTGNAASGKYPHARRYFMVTQPDPSAAARRFVAFVQSPAGREILIRTGNWIP